MSKIHLITYGDDKFKHTKQRLYNQALHTGWFNTIKIYEPNTLSIDFKEKFKSVLNLKRGGGYWIWKPQIIKERLSEIDDGDILVYMDAGCSINKQGEQRFREYINLLNDNEKSNIICFQMSHHLEKIWTTNEIFDYFNLSNESNVAISGQIIATIIIIKKNDTTVNIIDKWYNVLNDNPLLFTDHYNNNQFECFKDNRHDQSIFSVTMKLNNPIIFEDETYFVPFGSETSLKYPFWVTRIKN